ncbi:hypothetical protein [Dyella choica]|uniref:Uncharacterized protein n=1 Tax=Dyella choica TaxID=1927959 RepID=A0A3S0PL27_9GAMM|nr:hypothetical protein [Dyella choica]RUL73703.1 hypothetical protein EKH80_15435 [Dyella choica]
MKAIIRCRNSIIAALAVAVVGQSIVQAQSASPDTLISANAATDVSRDSSALADKRSWQSFLKLAGQPNAVVTLEDIKRSFHGRIVPTTMTGRYEIPGVLLYFVYVPERLHELFPDRKQMHVEVHFHDKDSHTCLTKEEMLGDLNKAQWKLFTSIPASVQPGLDGGPLVHYPPQTIFLKGDQGVLSIAYVDGCPENASMEANKIYFDMLTNKKTSEIGR